jgi:RNA polymerase sigma-70 factor (ECF subfamily)
MPSSEPPYDFDLVYREHVQRVARWAAWLLGPSSDVEDVVQEVFLTAHRLLPRFRGDAAVSTWLFQLTSNAVRAQRRRTGRWRKLQRGVQLLQTTTQALGPTPDEELERQREAALVYEALDAMPEKYRTLLVLFRLEGLSGEEIATLTGIRIATVWVRLHRARMQFAEQVERARRKRGEAPARVAKQTFGEST